MCGLVGVFSKYASGFTHELNDLFSTLLLVDTLRGDDSTGAFCVHMNGDMTLAKEASTGSEFLRQKEWKDLKQLAYREGACLIGHNRKATRGIINDENAHPFVVDDKIVLVHNGTMYGDHKKHADVEVDSHAIAHLLDEHKDPSVALGKFHGAYALMWYDVQEEVVNIIRNEDRPLWWMELDNAWVWASERDFLLFGAARQNLKIKQGPIMLDPHSLNIFALKNRKWEVGFKKLEIKRDFGPASGSVSTTTPAGTTTDETEEDFEAQVEKARNEWNERFMNARRAVANDFSDMDDDVPFDVQPKPVNGRKPSGKLDKQFPTTIGGNKWESTSEFEKSLAETCNRGITSGEFHREVIPMYGWGKEVTCKAFEYIEDELGGWYLYASPVDDPQVIVRHHFHYSYKVTEERIMHMALNEYTFKFEIDTRSWAPFSGAKTHDATERGYCVLTSRKATILNGGNIKETAHA